MCHLESPAQVKFSATISPATIGKNETAELRFAIDNATKVDRISPPNLKDFIVVSGPNQETGMESINGVTRRYIGVTYLVRPRRKGKIVIEPVIADADGKTFKTNRVVLTVTNENTSSAGSNYNLQDEPFSEPVVRPGDRDFILKKGENAADKINKNIFIKVDVDKRSCFEGEPIVVVYKLYTRLKSESSIVKNPSFNGFSVIDLLPPGNTYYSVEKLNGREYNVYTLRKSQLYPLQTGVIELESAEVENHIHFIKEEYLLQQNDLSGLFHDFNQANIPSQGLHDEKVTLRSTPVFITVKPLPEANKTLLFNGAVGNFTIESAVDKVSFTTDDAATLRVVLSGEGNMTMINAPDVSWPAGIESYDPGTREQLNKYAVPVSGMKVFEYPFTVAKAGNYTLPAVSFNFFDVKKNSYQTLTTKPFNITVTNGTGKVTNALKQPGTVNSKGEFFNLIFHNRWLIIAPLGILMITGIFLWLRKDKRRVVYEENVIAKASAQTPVMLAAAPIDYNPLRNTEEQLVSQHPKFFYETLNKDFRKFLADKFQLPVETINKKTIAEEADKRGISVNTCLEIHQLLDAIEWQLYTPFSEQEKMEEMYNTADQLVHKLNGSTS
ncbi:MAG: BatD family protein [Ferruginibacter sp.]|nr:BatD family protein [Ferruginibacter sp.]